MTKPYARAMPRILPALLLIAVLAACATPASEDVRQDDLDSSLIAAARTGNLHDFNLALKLGANLRAVDRDGTNAVLAATEGGQHGLLRQLLDKGVDPNARGGSGFTPLTFTAMRGANEDIAALLRAGARPNQHNALGAAPLHLAAEFGHTRAMTLLAAGGARVDDRDDAGETPLLAAIRAGRAESVSTLLDLGADPNAAGKSGSSALFLAILGGYEDIALTLLARGARPQGLEGGYTPLQMARFMGQSQLARALEQKGAR
jgi:ankyrin repeat protein